MSTQNIRALEQELDIKRTNEPYSVATFNLLQNLSLLYKEIDWLRSLQHGHDALAIALVLQDKIAQAQAHQNLYRLCKAQHQHEAALKHHEAWAMLNQLQTRNLAQQVVHQWQTQSQARPQNWLQIATTYVAQLSLQTDQAQALEHLVHLMKLHDYTTAIHTQRVGHFSAALAHELGLGSQMVEHIRMAAPLHDIGKLAMPNHILQKQTVLTWDETQIMRLHTRTGANVLAKGGALGWMRMAQTIALTHHEFWNGNGYPNQLAGNQIPISGRIVAVADAYDAMINDRPYRKALSKANALQEIGRHAGTQFDPNVVAAFRRFMR